MLNSRREHVSFQTHTYIFTLGQESFSSRAVGWFGIGRHIFDRKAEVARKKRARQKLTVPGNRARKVSSTQEWVSLSLYVYVCINWPYKVFKKETLRLASHLEFDPPQLPVVVLVEVASPLVLCQVSVGDQPFLWLAFQELYFLFQPDNKINDLSLRKRK